MLANAWRLLLRKELFADIAATKRLNKKKTCYIKIHLSKKHCPDTEIQWGRYSYKNKVNSISNERQQQKLALIIFTNITVWNSASITVLIQVMLLCI